MRHLRYLVLMPLLLYACHPGISTGKDLSKNDIAFIKSLGLLNEGEEILLFDTQAGYKGIKQAGNFITKERIAAYWIDKDRPENNKINAAFYRYIKNLTFTDLSRSLSYSSYIEVEPINGKTFKVYIDGDSTAVWNFYNKASNIWHKSRAQIKL